MKGMPCLGEQDRRAPLALFLRSCPTTVPLPYGYACGWRPGWQS